jgi:hypothetical protein
MYGKIGDKAVTLNGSFDYGKDIGVSGTVYRDIDGNWYTGRHVAQGYNRYIALTPLPVEKLAKMEDLGLGGLNVMKDYIQIRIDTDLKERFRQVAEVQNPGLPKNQVMSAVVREMIVEYIEKYKVNNNV